MKKAIISREEWTAFPVWSLLHFQWRCDYNHIVLSGNQPQMQQQCSSSCSLFLLTFFFPFLFFFFLLFRVAKRDGVYLILLCWHTRLGSDKRTSGAVLIQISACSQWIGAGKGSEIQCDNLCGEEERRVLHFHSSATPDERFSAQPNWFAPSWF